MRGSPTFFLQSLSCFCFERHIPISPNRWKLLRGADVRERDGDIVGRDLPREVLKNGGRKSAPPDAHTRLARTITLLDIANAVIVEGYYSLDKQANALGIKRSTAWTIMKNKHKLGRLSEKTTSRMLAQPGLAPSVRAVILQYVMERSRNLP
jgi:hypothetical protein